MDETEPRAAVKPAPTAYDEVGGRIADLATRLGLGAQAATVQRAYDLLCRDALSFPWGSRPVRASRLNADGTPFEFAVTAGGGPSSLQLLADCGPVEAGVAERLANVRSVATELAHVVGAEAAVGGLLAWLDEMAPADDPRLAGVGAGAAWVGAGFAAGGKPAMKVYVNGKWGLPAHRAARLDSFAARFGVLDAWRQARTAAGDELHPLGAAITASGSGTRGRIYLSGFGLPIGVYEQLARRLGDSVHEERVRRWAQVVLDEDYGYPTRSAVCSFGVQAGALTGLKLELCAHCAFDDDAQARRRCLRWLQEDGADPAPYLAAVAVLGGGAGTGRHAYVGVGGAGSPSTFYFNPAAAAAA